MTSNQDHINFILEKGYFGYRIFCNDFYNFALFSHTMSLTKNPFLNRFIDISGFNFFFDGSIKHIPESEWKTYSDNFIYYGTHQAAKFLTFFETQAHLRKINPNNVIMHNFIATMVARTAFFTIGELASNIAEDPYKWAFNLAVLMSVYTFKASVLPHHYIIAGLISGWLVNDIIHFNFPDQGKVEGFSWVGITMMLSTSHFLGVITGESSKAGIETVKYLEETIPAWFNGVFPHLNQQFSYEVDAITTVLGKMFGFAGGRAAAPYLSDAIIQGASNTIEFIEPTLNELQAYTASSIEYGSNKIQEFGNYLGSFIEFDIGEFL